MIQPQLKTCEECGQPFAAKRKNTRYCSTKCNLAKWRQDNPDAHRRYVEEHRDHINAQRRKGRKVREVSCEQCGTAFQTTHSHKRFCGSACQAAWYSANPDKKDRRNTARREWAKNNREKLAVFSNASWEKRKEREPWWPLLVSAKNRALKFGLEFSLDEAWVQAHWTDRCEVSGLPFTPPSERKLVNVRHFFPSIDRLNNDLGYTPDNCRFVLFAVNALRGNADDETMLKISKAIVAEMGK